MTTDGEESQGGEACNQLWTIENYDNDDDNDDDNGDDNDDEGDDNVATCTEFWRQFDSFSWS